MDQKLMPGKSFYITGSINPKNGPGIFSNRLRDELISLGYQERKEPSSSHLCVIRGEYNKNCKNFLRLDGCYFDSADRQTDQKNSSIFNCYKSFDHIIFQSEFSKQMFKNMTLVERPSTIIHNGVPKNFKPNGDIAYKSNKKVLICSARWRRHKRSEEIFKAMRDSRLKNVELLVLDNGDYFKKHGKISDNIIVQKRVEPHNLPQWYRSADAMVHIAWIDNCPNTVVESLACGVPVLHSHNGGTRELVKSDGVMVKLEKDYKPGSKVPLYNPEKVDINKIVEGMLEVLEKPKGFSRPDMSISHAAKRYAEVMFKDLKNG